MFVTSTATTSKSSSAATLDRRLIIPVVNAIRDVFKTMVMTDVKMVGAHIKTSPVSSYDVSGIIGFSGELVGTIVLSFQMDAAIRLASAFAGTAVAADSPDFPDAIGELANMVAGGAKKSFDLAANITPPNVIIGAGHVLARLSDIPCLVIPCETSSGAFAAEVSIKQVTVPGGAK